MVRPTERGVGGAEKEETGTSPVAPRTPPHGSCRGSPGLQDPTSSKEELHLASPSNASGNRFGTGRLGPASQEPLPLTRVVSTHPVLPSGSHTPHTLEAEEK